ncbi:Uncharacterised protein [Legionella pneumophila]|nr:hypothetical protein LPE509_00059 [Legionella pneumophila subsp. pneumophila LPE509]WBA07381.1 hypothetical protein LpnH3D14_03215 [Legionella pneumophila]CZG40801.1 Uncharacterised protein [Legionella pneumophila]CZG57699.1 Uncharacterised protein [Legionella pneumophila]CZG64157.1 Uncharacterised protein [Legionella pneumophila]
MELATTGNEFISFAVAVVTFLAGWKLSSTNISSYFLS